MTITPADFNSNPFKIAQPGGTTVQLTAFLSPKNIDRAIKQALGFDLGTAYDADEERFQDITDYIEDAPPDGCEGLKYIVVGLLWGEWTQRQPFINTATGDRSLNTQDMPMTSLNYTVMLNRVTREQHKLADYLADKQTLYPEYRYFKMNFISLL